MYDNEWTRAICRECDMSCSGFEFTVEAKAERHMDETRHHVQFSPDVSIEDGYW